MSLIKLIRKWPLTFYVIFNYSISWIFLYPGLQAILNAEEGTFPWLALISIPGGFGPSIAAILIVWLTEGKQAVLQLLGKFRSFRVHYKWYLSVLMLPMIIYLLSLLATRLFGFDIGSIDYKEGVRMFLPYLLLALPFGPLMEELGWRGYMLPALLEKYNIYLSSLILGVIWTCWHLASFTFPGAAIPSIFEVNFWTVSFYLLGTIAESFIFTYFYLRTGGNIYIAILLHTALNGASNIILTFFPAMADNVELRWHLFIINIFFIFITAFILFYRMRHKTKKVRYLADYDYP